MSDIIKELPINKYQDITTDELTILHKFYTQKYECRD